MDIDAKLLVALQSSLVLGLIHGVNPCGHSWLVLAPFTAGDADGWRVARLTTAFILGTALGCLAIGAVLGVFSAGLPPEVRTITDWVTAAILVVLGAILIWRPHLLHSHGHAHGHDHEHGHDHHHDHHDHHHDDHGHDHGTCTVPLTARRSTVWGLAGLGFVNMIVPCPTLAIMYSYAIDSADVFKATGVFASYAVGTSLALAGVIFAIFRVAGLIRTLQRPWIETAVMRAAGVLTIAFAAYSLYLDTAGGGA